MNRLRAFRFLARCLAHDPDAGPGRARLAAEIASGHIDWTCVIKIASEQWMTLALYWELDEKGLLNVLPEGLLEYFEYLHEANRTRNHAILDHTACIAVSLNEIGVEPLLLKGACNLASGLYQDPAARYLYDIDILVPASRALECWHRLISAGYRAPLGQDRLEDMPDREWPALVREGCTGELELHRAVEWHHMQGSPSLYTRSDPVALPRGRARILDPTGRMIFTLAHAFVHHRVRFQAAPHLRDLYDATLLLRRHGAEIDWPRVIDAFESAGEIDALGRAFLMWRRLFLQSPPCEIDPSTGSSLYWPRCLLGVAMPQVALICNLSAKNTELLKRSLSRTPQGRELRRSLFRSPVLLRKIRSAVRICTGAPAREE
ncbi:MAG: nucleotidyltransferase family protein [Bryobacteraceae bacterium]|jgi:hypothetical protein